jgi:radical SAM superfamily enzyme YgiQ (UPF0313 family)
MGAENGSVSDRWLRTIGFVRVLLLSTYELGHQPLHVATAASALDEAGHRVSVADLSVAPLDDGAVDAADAVAISVPMHTATRLAASVVAAIAGRRPDLPIALFGLYGAVGASGLGALVDQVVVGEYEPGLVEWADGLDRGRRGEGSVRVDLGVTKVPVPRRDGLPPLSRYTHLEVGSDHRRVGSVEASRGCRHRCRHCPIPSVYDGRFRIVDVDTVVADVDQLVESGARHITFGDPDFFNGPAHAMKVLEAVAARHRDLSYDLTIKVEHLLRHRDLLGTLSDLGALFVVSAFETVSDRILELLDKGHTVADMAEAVSVCRAHGIDVHPSWLPFTPWTTGDDVLGIFRFLDRHELMDVTDPVQMGIRLLVPEGSLLERLPEFSRLARAYVPERLGYEWEYEDPSMDGLQRRLASMAEAAADDGSDRVATLVEMWRTVLDHQGEDITEAQIPAGAIAGRPRLTEPWFC